MGTIQIDGSTPKLTIGNATAEDATILFDGNAQDFYIALDDSADDLLIGLGSTVGSTPIIAIDENKLSTFSGAVTVGVDNTGHDVKLFGASAGAYALWDESANLLDLRGATAAGPGHLKLTTGELTVVDADVLGRIDFQAPLETGSDAILVAASIWAEADDTFAAGVNNTDIVFATGKSETAAEKFRFTADTEIGIGGANYGTDGQVLTSGGAGAACAWEDAAGAVTALNNATANELVTVGSTTTELDAESNLTFDGSTFTVGTGSATADFSINNDSNNVMVHFQCNDVDDAVRFYMAEDSGGGTMIFQTKDTGGNIQERMRIDNAGALSIQGALSKGSGSFKIKHPLLDKKETHHLVHSFVESPRADLIYRGKATLSSGSATVNIDTSAGMTEGTFVALCDDVQCFTTNESNWDLVKASVSGNTLTIESQNSDSTAEISWLVLGDRKDEHIMDTEWTDEFGKPIIEPLIPEEE